MPVLLYQIWAFVAPGLTPAERKTVRPWIPLALLVLRARRRRSPTSSCHTRSRSCCRSRTTSWSPSSRPAPYFDFVTTMFLVFGLIMEFPIVLVGLSRVGIVTSAAAPPAAPDGHPRDRRLLGSRDTGRRPHQPPGPGRDDVPPVRGDRPVHPAHRAVTERAGIGDGHWSLGRPRRRRRAGRHHPERPVRRRQDRRGEAVRGPRLHRHRQPAR